MVANNGKCGVGVAYNVRIGGISFEFFRAKSMAQLLKESVLVQESAC